VLAVADFVDAERKERAGVRGTPALGHRATARRARS
jgi:hypothetical protein